MQYSFALCHPSVAQDGGRKEQADQQGQEGRKEEDVSCRINGALAFHFVIIKKHRLICIVLCSVDPFAKKDWYDVKAPSTFSHRGIGKTLVTRTQGTKVGMPIDTSLEETRCGTRIY